MAIPTKERLLKVAKFELECVVDDVPFVGNCSAIDPVTDKANEDYIQRQLTDGNAWAWCVITLRASWGGMTATTTLCGCSYESQREFERDENMDAMKMDAVEELHAALTDKRRRDRGKS